MPRASKSSASETVEVEGYEGHFEDFGAYTVGFETYTADADLAALFTGLPDDRCQCPHWGFVLNGQLTTTDAEGRQETVCANDLFYWPPGHNVRVDADAEIVMFSPQHEHSRVIEHMREKVQAG